MSNSNEPPSPRSLPTPQQHFAASSFGNVQLQPVSPSPVPQATNTHNVFVQNPSKMQSHVFHHSFSPMLQPPLLNPATAANPKQQQQQQSPDVTAAMSSIMNNVPPHFAHGLIPPPIQQQPYQQQQQQQQQYHHSFHHHPHHHHASMLATPISSTPAPMMPSPAQSMTAVAQRNVNAASKKRKINKLACQYCSKLHKKCDGDSPMPCTRCHTKGVECVYVQRAKRGPKTKRQKQNASPSNNSNGNAAPPNATPASPLSDTVHVPMDAHATMSSLLPQPSISMHHMPKQSFVPQHLQPQNWNRMQLNTAPTPPPQPMQLNSNNMFAMYPPPSAQHNNNTNNATLEHHSVQSYPFLPQTPHPSFAYQPIPYAPTPTPTNSNNSSNNWSLPTVSFPQQQQAQHQQPAMVQTPNPFPFNMPSSNFQFMQPSLDLSSFNMPTLASNNLDGHHQDAFPSVVDVPAPYEEHDDAFVHRQ